MKIESIKLKNFETMNPKDIVKKLEENRDTILSFGVRQLGVFGSCARGEQTETSDLDFLVEFDDSTFDNYFDLKFFLEKLFGSPVDLVIKDTIKSKFEGIEWVKLIGFRNILIHDYFGVKLETVWNAIQEKIPALEEQTRKALGE